MEQFGDFVAVPLRQLFAAEFHKVGAELVLVQVEPVLVSPDLFVQFRGIGADAVDCGKDRPAGQLRHLHGRVAALFNCKRRRVQKTLVQKRHVRLVLFRGRRAVAHGKRREFGELGREGQQNCGGQQVERGVYNRNAYRVERLRDKVEMKNGVKTVKQNQEQDCSDNIEIQMHHRRALGVLVRTNARYERGDTCAYILTHNNRDGAAICNAAGDRQRLQNANRGRGALDDGRQRGAHQNAEERVGEHDEHLLEFRYVRQWAYCVAHGGHAEHEHGKADEDRTDIPSSCRALRT